MNLVFVKCLAITKKNVLRKLTKIVFDVIRYKYVIIIDFLFYCL